MQLKKDIWRPLIVEAPLDEIVRRGSLDGFAFRWLPAGPDLTFSADPFAIWRDGLLFIFVENFDYRTAHGTIAVHVLDDRLRWIESRTVLQEPWHLSYPFVFEWLGDVWMMPEGCASGTQALYRAADFPWRWEKAHHITLDVVPLDATPFRHDGRWWLFYGTAGSAGERLTQLNLAWAEDISGPWTPHPANPVFSDPHGARPGGSAWASNGQVVLPVQDCRASYGSALRLLHITTLTEHGFAAHVGQTLHAPADAAPFIEGCHTLSAAGPMTLIDVKKRDFSLKGLTMRPRRDLARLLSAARS